MRIVKATSRRLNDSPVAMLVLAAAATVAVLVPGIPVPVRTVAAAVLLVIPGVFAARLAVRDRGFVADALVWATASGIALVVLVGLVLDRIPGGLHRTSWVAGLDILAVLLALAWWRARRTAAYTPLQVRSRWTWVVARAGVLAVAVAIAVTAVSMDLRGAHTQAQSAPFAQVWLLPSGSGHVLVGVRSGRSAPTTYRLTLMADGRPMRHWRSIRLGWGDQWQALARVPASVKQGSHLTARVDAPSGTVPSEHAALFWTG